MQVKCASDVRILERDGHDWWQANENVCVSSHWNDNRSYVVLTVPGVDGTFTVSADALRIAINNATNCR